MLAALIFFTGCEKENQISSVNGLFSVAEGRQVRFAPGNLEYSGGYRFAENQYDYGGYFGWGTGSNPTLTSTESSLKKTRCTADAKDSMKRMRFSTPYQGLLTSSAPYWSCSEPGKKEGSSPS